MIADFGKFTYIMSDIQILAQKYCHRLNYTVSTIWKAIDIISLS